MKNFFVLIYIAGGVLSAVCANGADKYPWPMFLPAIITPQTAKCDLEHLEFCEDNDSCETIGGYWWAQQCNQSRSSSDVFMAKLAGDIHFTYNMFGWDWNEYYHFDINTLRESSSQTGYFVIDGIDAYGNKVTVIEHGYNSIGAEMYSLINDGFSGVDEWLSFGFISATSVSGWIYVKDKSTSSWGDAIGADLYGTHSE